MQIDTRSGPFQIGNPGGNSTAGSIVEPLPSGSPPNLAAVSSGVTNVGDGVIEMAGADPGALEANGLQIIPYGAGSATNTYTLKVYGWRRTRGASGIPAGLWIPYLLASFTVTLGTAPGLANYDVNASQLFATTITLLVGNANISNEIISPGSNVIAHIMLDAKGANFVETRYAMVSATSGNCLIAKV